MNALNFVNDVNQKMLMNNKNKLHKDLFEKISQKKMDDAIFNDRLKTITVRSEINFSLFLVAAAS